MEEEEGEEEDDEVEITSSPSVPSLPSLPSVPSLPPLPSVPVMETKTEDPVPALVSALGSSPTRPASAPGSSPTRPASAPGSTPETAARSPSPAPTLRRSACERNIPDRLELSNKGKTYANAVVYGLQLGGGKIDVREPDRRRDRHGRPGEEGHAGRLLRCHLSFHLGR